MLEYRYPELAGAEEIPCWFWRLLTLEALASRAERRRGGDIVVNPFATTEELVLFCSRRIDRDKVQRTDGCNEPWNVKVGEMMSTAGATREGRRRGLFTFG